MTSSTTEQQARDAAERFRADHKLGVQPLGDLVALIEQSTGHDVAVLDADPDEHGLTMRDPARGTVFIGVARTPHPMRQRSTLAHELAHLIFGDQSVDLAERSPEESRADAFARHLLVPQQGLKEFLGEVAVASESTLSDVVQRFLVSPAIAAIAMRDAGYISAGTAAEWRNISTPAIATRFGWQDQYLALQRESQRPRAPQALVARAIAGYAEGVVSAQTIATLRGVGEGQIVEELRQIGILPPTYDDQDFEIADLPTVEVDLTGLEVDGEDA